MIQIPPALLWARSARHALWHVQRNARGGADGEGICLLLISGGPDSVFLFHYFLELKKKDGIDFQILHVNHHLRGEESDADEKFVRDLAHTHGITCHVRSLKNLKEEFGNLQDRARRERQRFCFELQVSHQITHAVTAHHADDVLETLIMRRLRGAGLKGMTGIRTRSVLSNPLHSSSQLIVWRPLLKFCKSEILDSLNKNKIAYRLDSSNQDPKYFRNRVRQALVSKTCDVKLLVERTEILQLCDDYFAMRCQNLVTLYPEFMPLTVWQNLSTELQFRYFAAQMNCYGYKKEVERKHFQTLAAPRAKLVLNQACVVKNKKGCRFSRLNRDTAILG